MNAICLDAGNGTTIVAGKKSEPAVIRSFLSTGDRMKLVDEDDVRNRIEPEMTVFCDGEQYYLGENSRYVGTPQNVMGTHRLLNGSGYTRIMMFAALTKFAQSGGNIGGKVALAVAVPQMVASDQLRNKIEEYFLGTWRWVVDGVEYSINIEETHAISQAKAAIMDYVFNDRLRTTKDKMSTLRGRIAVTSIGAGTAEALVLDNMIPIEQATDSKELGVLSMFRSITKDTDEYEKLDRDLRENRFDKYNQHLRQWSLNAVGFYSALWNQSMRDSFDLHIGFGGGVTALNGAFTPDFPNMMVPNNSITTCAEGGYKWLAKQLKA